MRIKIDSLTNMHEKYMISFSVKNGKGKGIWCGESPIVGLEYYVEVDINDDLAWGKNILETRKEIFSIDLFEEKIILTGKICSVDSDGYVILDLGDSSITFLAAGTALPVESYVRLEIKELLLYPVNY